MSAKIPDPAVSPQQNEVLLHLRASGGMTMPALGVILGPKVRKTLRRLLKRRIVKISEASGIRLFMTVGTPFPKTEESFYRRVALGWLYARVIEAGCKWKNGVIPQVIFPNGVRMKIAWRGKTGRKKGRFLALMPAEDAKMPQLPPGSLILYADALREKELREALTARK